MGTLLSTSLVHPGTDTASWDIELAAKARQKLLVGDGSKEICPRIAGGSLPRGGEEMELPSVQSSWQREGLPASRALQAEGLAVLEEGHFSLHLPPFLKA